MNIKQLIAVVLYLSARAEWLCLDFVNTLIINIHYSRKSSCKFKIRAVIIHFLVVNLLPVVSAETRSAKYFVFC